MRRLRTTIAAVAMLATLVAVPTTGAREHDRGRTVRSYIAPAHPLARLDIPCANADRNAADATARAFAGALMCLVNQQRARRGIGALHPRAMLAAVGLRHANSMVVHDFFGHFSPGGLSYRQRVLRAGYYRKPAVGFLAGENIAWSSGNQATPATIVRGWMRSASHRAEILDARYRDAGVGVMLASPPSLNRKRLAGATAAMEFGALTYATARIARRLNG